MVIFVLWYLRFWAHTALAIHRPIVVGIAGSAGKSSTKQLLYAMIKGQASVSYADGNSETGVPLGILGLPAGGSSITIWIKNILKCPLKIFHLKGQKYLIVEMATDDPQPPKNMDYLLSIVQPDAAIHLNAQPIHTQQFTAALNADQLQLTPDQQQPHIINAIAYEDAKLVSRTQANPSVYNADDQALVNIYLPIMAKQPNRTIASFGHSDTNQLTYQNYSVSDKGTVFSFLLNRQPATVELPGYILPQHFQQLVGAALLTCTLLKMDPAASIKSLAQHLHLPKGRSTVLPGVNNSAILDSTYNASTTATQDMLALLTNLKQQTGRPTVLLLGDMRELGDQAAIEHTKILESVKGIADYLYAVGPLTKQYIIDPLNQLHDAPAHIRWFENALQAGEYMKNNLPANALVLAKGSQNTIYLEEAVKQLLADPADAAKLCRQDKQWLKVKQRYFATSIRQPATAKTTP